MNRRRTLASWRIVLGTIIAWPIALTWAAQGTWVAPLPGQTVVMSERPLAGVEIQPPPSLAEARIDRVRWTFRTDAPAPALKAWLCQQTFCLPLAGRQGETQHFSGRSAASPFRLRFQLPIEDHGVGRVRVSAGQLIIDYRG
ncbi:flagellar protein FlhE [Salinicola sp. CR57]|uniref:flagellar protein FlhE n=1 Tax=Salinicola sp. CR57 TaxID=1949086 RepID=UPI000DA1BE96|nr:flagellar protein FlhE [Salinicola sp. CR57]